MVPYWMLRVASWLKLSFIYFACVYLGYMPVFPVGAERARITYCSWGPRARRLLTYLYLTDPAPDLAAVRALLGLSSDAALTARVMCGTAGRWADLTIGPGEHCRLALHEDAACLGIYRGPPPLGSLELAALMRAAAAS